MAQAVRQGTTHVVGRVTLPIHLKWSGPTEYDLGDEEQRRLVYEVVLREGGEEDVRRFIDPEELLRLWSRLVLPTHVRAAWRDYVRFVRGVDPDGAQVAPAGDS